MWPLENPTSGNRTLSYEVFHWSLSDSKSLQVSRTLLSILAVLNNVVVWMVSTRPPTSKSSSSFSNLLVTVPNAPITIGIIVTCIFHSFFNSLARLRYWRNQSWLWESFCDHVTLNYWPLKSSYCCPLLIILCARCSWSRAQQNSLRRQILYNYGMIFFI